MNKKYYPPNPDIQNNPGYLSLRKFILNPPGKTYMKSNNDESSRNHKKALDDFEERQLQKQLNEEDELF